MKKMNVNKRIVLGVIGVILLLCSILGAVAEEEQKKVQKLTEYKVTGLNNAVLKVRNENAVTMIEENIEKIKQRLELKKEDKIELEANISQVIDESCDGCAYCVEPCPYQAITLIEYMKEGAVKKTVEVDETACKGCGCCMATCPKKGIFVKGFNLEQIGAQIKAALEVQG